MRILTFTTLYPSAVRPQHGIFVETRLRKLVESGRVASRVVAPCPWFPSDNPRFGSYAAFARIPAREERHGIAIDHPRFLLLPRLAMSMAPFSMAASLLPALRRQIRTGADFDVIDAHYFFPDGVAAVMLGRALGRPVVVTARGTDLNIIPNYAIPRRLIKWAATHAAGLITVSAALKDRLVALGIGADRVTVLRNGVDLELFRPGERATGERPRLLAVGNLVALKGHAFLVEALAELPEFELAIAGEGPERASLEAQARRLGVADRFRLLGRVPQHELPALYRSAELLLLPSSHEGWPNVLLESMACGTPVIASPIPGMGEVVQRPEAGRLLAERSAAAIVAAVRELQARPIDRAATRAYAEGFGWEATTRGQIELFQAISRR